MVGSFNLMIRYVQIHKLFYPIVTLLVYIILFLQTNVWLIVWVIKETTQTVQSIQSQTASIEEISNQSNKIKEKVEALSKLVSKFIIEK